MANSCTPAMLEALLFIYGDPLDPKKAAKMLGVSVAQVQEAAAGLREALAAGNSGLALIEHDGQLQLATRSEFGSLLQTVLKAELQESLSPAALETLSIITYAGPVTRAEIDYIRGVNSSFIIRALLLRGLISREADPQRANSYRYQASIELMSHLGIERAADLPEYDRFRTLVEGMRRPTANDATTDAATQAAPPTS